VNRLPETVLHQLRLMRKRAPSTWTCTSTYHDLVSPFINGKDPLTVEVIQEIIRQIKGTQ
jgi:hypothetical protein